MAIILDFDICINNACDTLTLTETTGAYSATNTGGWGAPNATTASVITAILQVTAPDGTVSTIPTATMSAAGFPSSNPSFTYTIPNASLGGITNVTDGHWKFFLYYTDGTTVYQKVRNYLFYCNTECCVQQLLSDIEVEDCDCCNQDDKIKTYTKAKTFLESLKNAARCYQVSNFESIQAVLTALCNNSGCTTCK